ncbi:hypothetical protein XI02_11715 [Bradyrhizobium sp. CCBAU 21365]|nr:hypothetical protein XI02_11715 [Bradyrhizobium sp. CCBAU 21365]
MVLATTLLCETFRESKMVDLIQQRIAPSILSSVEINPITILKTEPGMAPVPTIKSALASSSPSYSRCARVKKATFAFPGVGSRVRVAEFSAVCVECGERV